MVRYVNNLVLVLALLAIAACSQSQVQDTPTGDSPVSSEETQEPMPTPMPGSTSGAERSPLDPIPGEEKMTRGPVIVEAAQVLVMESYPLQVALSVEGTLPDPCHYLRAEVKAADSQNKIQVELYSMVDPEMLCIQVIQPFATSIPLGSYSETGSYQVLLNGELVGEFES